MQGEFVFVLQIILVKRIKKNKKKILMIAIESSIVCHVSGIYVKVSPVGYIFPTTHQKALVFGPWVPGRVCFPFISSGPWVHALGWG